MANLQNMVACASYISALKFNINYFNLYCVLLVFLLLFSHSTKATS
jgi:hypothetical protein